jgi:hypothetical protein
MINIQNIIRDWGLSSVYDFVIGGVPRDGKTDANDLAVVQQNIGTTCRDSHAIF